MECYVVRRVVAHRSSLGVPWRAACDAELWYLLAVVKVKVVVHVRRAGLVWVRDHVVFPVRKVSTVQLSEKESVVAVVATAAVGVGMLVRGEERLVIIPRLARERIFQAKHLLVMEAPGGEDGDRRAVCLVKFTSILRTRHVRCAHHACRTSCAQHTSRAHLKISLNGAVKGPKAWVGAGCARGVVAEHNVAGAQQLEQTERRLVAKHFDG